MFVRIITSRQLLSIAGGIVITQKVSGFVTFLKSTTITRWKQLEATIKRQSRWWPTINIARTSQSIWIFHIGRRLVTHRRKKEHQEHLSHMIWLNCSMQELCRCECIFFRKQTFLWQTKMFCRKVCSDVIPSGSLIVDSRDYQNTNWFIFTLLLTSELSVCAAYHIHCCNFSIKPS